MLCERCKQRDAKIHVTQIKSGNQTSVHLCPICAQESGISSKKAISIQSLISTLAGAGEEAAAAVNDDARAFVSCRSCGMSYNDFRQTGRFGCKDCYRVFEPHVSALIQKVQRGEQHEGKIPKRTGILLRDRIEDLRIRLTRAVEQEEFEAAARLRDEIRALEGAEESSGRPTGPEQRSSESGPAGEGI